MKRYFLCSLVLFWMIPGYGFAETDHSNLRIRLTVNGHTIFGYLNNSVTTHHLSKKLPMTLAMRNLYSREMVCRFPDSLPTDNVTYSGYKVGEIIYWPPGNAFVIMYAQNGEWFSMQKVGSIESDLSYFKDIKAANVMIELMTKK